MVCLVVCALAPECGLLLFGSEDLTYPSFFFFLHQAKGVLLSLCTENLVLSGDAKFVRWHVFSAPWRANPSPV